jgi:hypothetical protein
MASSLPSPPIDDADDVPALRSAHPSDLDALFSDLAEVARPAGSEEESIARQRCIEWLRAHGYTCVERPFTYSAWPGHYGVAAVGGVLVVAGAIACAGSLLHMLAAALTLSFGFVVIALALGVLLTRYGTVHLPWMRRTGVNVEARRTAHGQGVTGDLGEPDVWLVAHLDSKSQTISMRVRVSAVVVCTLAWIALAVLGAAQTALVVTPLAFTVVTAAATVAAFPLAVCYVGREGSGAFDNASGVATVLGAIEYLDPAHPVGVLLTSAEELGLAGARAWVAGRARHESGGEPRPTPRPTPRSRPGLALNCDGVDDEGNIVCMVSGATEYQFRDAFHRAGMMAGEDIIVRPLIPGVLVDAVAFKDAGWQAVTVSRGTWRSLARVHTHADNSMQITGRGIARTAQFIGRLTGAMVAEGRR